MPDFATWRVNMVDSQIRPSNVTLYPVIAAMLEVPREVFVPEAFSTVAYADQIIPLESGRVVLEPRTLGKMLNALAPEQGVKALDYTCGTGYGAALLARMGAVVTAVEEDGALAAAARDALGRAGLSEAEVTVTDSLPVEGGFDVILVSGGGVEELPEAVTDQLREGGRVIALFVDGALGTVCMGRATSAGLVWRELFNAFAPVMPGFARERIFAL